MSLTVNDLTVIYPEQLLLEFTPKKREQIWQQIQQGHLLVSKREDDFVKDTNYLSVTARWHTYLNYLCLDTVLHYLNNEQEFNFIPKVWKQTELPNLWQLVTGTAIEINKTRLILIPHEENNSAELRVPREWVDIPGWTGNYYLGVEINLEQCWLRVYGYTTYEQIRNEGKYDPVDETYSLSVEDLSDEPTVLWTMIELDFKRQQQFSSFPPPLSTTDVMTLLAKLNHSDRGCLRLNLPFEQWGALIADYRWRTKLYQQQKLMETFQIDTPINDLSQWFQGIFTSGWHSLAELLDSETDSLAYSLRGLAGNQLSTVEGVKLLDLGMQLGDQSVALLIGMTPEIDDKIGIRVQLHPARGKSHLPNNIKLALLTKSGRMLQEFQARSQDELLQLKRFTCPRKKQFLIRVALNSYSITEEFAIN